MFKVLLFHKGNMKSVGKIANLFNKLYCGISNIQEFSDREMFFFFFNKFRALLYTVQQNEY